jgi:hypothetical protein
MPIAVFTGACAGIHDLLHVQMGYMNPGTVTVTSLERVCVLMSVSGCLADDSADVMSVE